MKNKWHFNTKQESRTRQKLTMDAGFTPHPKYLNGKVKDKWHIRRNLNGQMPRAIATGAGFTIFEIIVSISLFVIIILMTGSLYQISQKSYNKGSDGAELTQNARVSLDRLSRELRQATDIVTSLPASEIFFRDGHDISKITYIKYYLNGSDLMRIHTAYYFGADQSVYVPYGSLDIYGDPASQLILDSNGEAKIIGEYFNNLQFSGIDNLINISMELAKNQNKLNAETKIYTRN